LENPGKYPAEIAGLLILLNFKVTVNRAPDNIRLLQNSTHYLDTMGVTSITQAYLPIKSN
jgi:hypothetical protein